MSKQSNPILTLSVLASGAVPVYRFVTPAGAVAGAGANTLGASVYTAADTERVPVVALGTAIVEAGAAVSVNDTLKSDSTGRAITWATSGAKVALALQAATAAGQFIEVLLIPNVA